MDALVALRSAVRAELEKFSAGDLVLSGVLEEDGLRMKIISKTKTIIKIL